ncbi:GNAT family N-acetyltransferase [Kitasatospora sp. NPDC048365]|uniref:GNAT family N-acetyltransferase n=1 Tax=Kitasatospora sp. NPDC048365 TaxID=3364050 RepID=UPI0037247AEB
MTRMSSHHLTIRAATTMDDTALAELDHAVWSTLHAVAPQPPEGRPFFDESHTPAQHLVAELDGRLVGYVRQVPPTSLRSNAHVRQIQGLGVLPDARGLGVGDALIEAACEAARAAGARKMTLRVLAHNGPARRLYERRGFTVDGILPGEFLLDGAYVDDVWMGRSLTA